jgi:hypothetical protein
VEIKIYLLYLKKMQSISNVRTVRSSCEAPVKAGKASTCVLAEAVEGGGGLGHFLDAPI